MSGEAKAYFLVGPTAVGKTAVAQFLAEKLGWPIVSADSMLVYRGMDIGTAKPAASERKRADYRCIDIVDPNSEFTAWDFLNAARSEITALCRQGRDVIVAGGTGLYIKALLQGLRRAPKGGADVRARLQAMSIESLQAELRQADPAAWEALGESDRQNPRRVIRAIERVGSGGGREAGKECAKWSDVVGNPPLAGLSMPTQELNNRIETRVNAMYASGLVDEVRGLLVRYGALSATAQQAIGYSEAAEFLAGSRPLDECIERTTVRTRQLAKRQRTWFRHQAIVEWTDVALDTPVEIAAEKILATWRHNGPARIAEG